MGILSGLFRKPQPKTGSLLLEWAEQRSRDLQDEDEVTPEMIFAGLIYGLATFVRPRPQTEYCEKREEQGLYDNFETEFANDSALFELGCYMFFRVDLWLFQNRPNLRRQMWLAFLHEYVSLFTPILQITNIADLLEERVRKYAALARSGAEIQQFHDYLYELILRTKGNRKPRHYDFDNEPLSLNALQGFALGTRLETWETVMLPTILDGLEKTTDMMKRGPVDNDAT